MPGSLTDILPEPISEEGQRILLDLLKRKMRRAAAPGWGEHGIRINCVCPGLIRTTLDESMGFLGDSEREARVSAVYPIGRTGTPEEVAAAVLWLCSEVASFVTGRAMAVGGGYVAQRAWWSFHHSSR